MYAVIGSQSGVLEGDPGGPQLQAQKALQFCFIVLMLYSMLQTNIDTFEPWTLNLEWGIVSL